MIIFNQVFLKLDKDQSGKWSWKMFKKLVKKADKSAELDVTKLLWDELLLTADQKNRGFDRRRERDLHVE